MLKINHRLIRKDSEDFKKAEKIIAMLEIIEKKNKK
jgi:hypothetical protein